MKSSRDQQTYREAVRDAKAAIARASEANDVMIKTMADVLREAPSATPESNVANLVRPMLDADPADIVVMWAVLILQRAEAVRDGA